MAQGSFRCGLSDLIISATNEPLAVAAPFVALLHPISGLFVSKIALRIGLESVPVLRQGGDCDHSWAVS